ncbi:SAM-dependent methyltransferase [Streptomyces scabiei]|uniref:SAM-dependent methyltransferase n=1 Tax=Streptomyces scabiei TaxID=1930 RepID=UPI0036ECB7E7
MITRYDHRSVELQDEHTEQAWSAYRQSDMPQILDGYHKAVVLAALMRTGVLQRLREGRTDLGDLLGTLDPYFGEKLLRWLSTAGYTRRVEGGYAPTEAGAALLSDTALAQLSFYIEAYGPVTQRIEDLLRGTAHYGRDIQRDGAALGRSCNILFDLYHIDVVLEAFARRSATCALDLGCGAGGFLIEAARRDQQFHGIGLDISEGAIAEASKRAVEAGVAERVSFHVADAFDAATWPAACTRADALFAAGVLHEHFRQGEDAVIEILNRFAAAWSGGLKSIILGEPELYYDRQDNDSDLDLVHILTLQGFPRRHNGWLDLFPRSDLACRAVYSRRNAGPRFAFYDLVPRGLEGTE